MDKYKKLLRFFDRNNDGCLNFEELTVTNTIVVGNKVYEKVFFYQELDS